MLSLSRMRSVLQGSSAREREPVFFRYLLSAGTVSFLGSVLPQQWDSLTVLTSVFFSILTVVGQIFGFVLREI